MSSTSGYLTTASGCRIPLIDIALFAERYPIDDEIGTGGSSSIYTVSGRPELVIKASCIFSYWSSDFIERVLCDFYNEFHCLVKAAGIAGVPKVYDHFAVAAGPTEESFKYQLYLVMERVDVDPFWSLETVVEEEGEQPDLKLVVPWLLTTVADLHDRDILYGDFQLMNTLIDKKGQPYLVDFGEACYIGPGTDQTRTTYNTSYKIVPEQELEGPEGFPITKASDIYRLGRLFKELPGIPEPLVEECCQIDPAARPDSARLRELAATF